MKGTIFLKPLEYNIEAIGEKWLQGEMLYCTLKIKNHSAERIELPLLKAALCEGNYKKIKAKDKKGWKILSENLLAPKLTIHPAEELDYTFEFKLDENCSITDKNGSLYLAIFDNVEVEPAVHIELVIAPKKTIQLFLQILENFLRFKVKEIKSGKASVEVKLMAPASRELANVDGLVLNISEIDKTLTLNYLFNIRVLNITGATVQSEKATKEAQQVFTAKQYCEFGDSINQDFIIESVQSVLNTVKTKML